MPQRKPPLGVRADVERLEAEVARLKRELEASSPRLRRDLVANISHDLRTPLVSLHGHLEMLVSHGDALPPEQRAQYLAVALRQSERLARLIDGLFALAKLDFEDMVLQGEPFALDERVDDVLQKFQLLANEQGLATTRRIVELHGSHINVASQHREGTHFMFALPLAGAKPC